MLKWIGLWAMTVDHIGAIWFDYQTPITTLIGRMAFPIFAFLTGVNVLRSSKPERYTAYLLIAGILSQPIYVIAFEHDTGLPLNVLFTLGIGAALSTSLFANPTDRWYWRPIFIIPTTILLSTYVEYSTPGVLLITTITCTAWCIRCDFWGLLLPAAASSYLAWMINGMELAYSFISVGTLTLATLFMGRPLRSRKYGERWFFYAYYPLHLTILASMVLAPIS